MPGATTLPTPSPQLTTVTGSLSSSNGININAIVAVGKKKYYSTSFSTTPNQAYGVVNNVTSTCTENYVYAVVVDMDTTVEVEQNEAYSANIVTTGNEAYYATNTFTVGSKAYYGMLK